MSTGTASGWPALPQTSPFGRVSGNDEVAVVGSSAGVHVAGREALTLNAAPKSRRSIRNEPGNPLGDVEPVVRTPSTRGLEVARASRRIMFSVVLAML